MPSPQKKNLLLALGLNYVLPGVGYLYIGRPIVGTLCALIILLFLGISIEESLPITPIWILVSIIITIDMCITAFLHRRATKECPNCAELVARKARFCPVCGTSF